MLALAMSQTAGKRDPFLRAMHAEISSKSAAGEKLEPFGFCLHRASQCLREHNWFVSNNRDSCRCVCEQDRREDESGRWSRTSWGAQWGPSASISLRPAGGSARLRVGSRAQQ
eukprot:6212573-Pleurochrysis_carterae.AAC.4